QHAHESRFDRIAPTRPSRWKRVAAKSPKQVVDLIHTSFASRLAQAQSKRQRDRNFRAVLNPMRRIDWMVNTFSGADFIGNPRDLVPIGHRGLLPVPFLSR